MLGHGRSVTVLCALLVALGVSERWQDAEILVQSRRPRARLNKVQREAISLWRKYIVNHVVMSSLITQLK